MKKILETGIILFAMFGFWGMIYPDLCFTEEICRIIICDEENPEDAERSALQKDIYTRICEAQPDEIVIKSKLLDAFEIGTGKNGASEKESKGKSNVNNGYREESNAERGSGGGI